MPPGSWPISDPLGSDAVSKLASIAGSIDTYRMARSSSKSERSSVSHADEPPSLLPDFCDGRVLLVVLLVAEALAVVLTLSQAAGLSNIWASLGNISFFILGIALIDAAVLCYSNRYLHRLSTLSSSFLLYLILQLVTLIITYMSYLLLDMMAAQPFSEYTLVQALVRNLSISLIITGVMLRYFYVHHQNTMRRKSEEMARIEALQARIRPHFLFNSLNTITNLVHQNPDEAEEAILDLAELFRSTLNKSTHITVIEELDIVKRYLKMEQLRLGERLHVEWDVDENTSELPIPGLLIQPLVENAVYHGIEPLATGGIVSISVQRQASNLIIKVSNPLYPNSGPQRTGGNQLAIENIQQRLALFYGSASRLTIEKDELKFCVTLSLPLSEIQYANTDRR